MNKKFIREYLTFSKNDRILIIILVCIFGIITILPRTPFFKPRTHPSDISALPDDLNLPKEKKEETGEEIKQPGSRAAAGESDPTTVKLFYFDPNYLSQDEWALLGVNKRTSASIKKYLQKGGAFKKPEDLFKIYLLDKALAKQLLPYVRFKEVQLTQPATREIAKTSEVPPYPSFPAKQYRKVRINEADTSDFQTFPGIGSSLSNRIIKYREALGGFISTNQIGEVYNLPDPVFQNIYPYLELDSTPVKKININTITRENLPRHPYLTFGLSTAIIQYRDQHGRYKTVEDLGKLHHMDEKLFQKIAPYLSVE